MIMYNFFDNNRFGIVYRITINDNRSIQEHAFDITIEQTVETPPDCVPQSHFTEGIVGKVEEITKIENLPNTYDVIISYRNDITAFNVPQFLSVIFGNISLKNSIRIQKLLLPQEFSSFLPGPVFGIDGIRSLTGIYNRPLTCTALKPLGLSIDELASMTYQYAKGGIDFIKDDHGITNQSFHPFKERVARCQEMVTKANAETGFSTMYFPSVCGSFDTIEEQVQYAATQGVRGILIAPMLVGADTVRYLSSRYNLIILGHPAFAGAFTSNNIHGFTAGAWFGTFFRLLGSDISIFPNWGGRFQFTREECIDIAEKLKEPMPPWKKSFPSPAGGMNVEKVDAMIDAYGKDSVLLIGGALIQMSKDLQKNTEIFLNKIRSRCPEVRETPIDPFVSSCEVPKSKKQAAISHEDILPFVNYTWHSRESNEYKADTSIPFKGITRTELLGQYGEKTKFDLRYFEIEPNGFSSFEQHVHEHVIIGVRGKGLLIKKGKQLPINVHDIGYVAPLEPHQLRNESNEPFGFFCIVDHERDRPIPVN